MAIDITVDALIAANRVGGTTLERAEISRLRDYAIAEISQYVGTAYDTIDPVIVNEAAIRLVGYLYDQPSIARGAAFANALRNSGAGRMLFRFRVHRAGLATADEAMAAGIGTTGNPVVDVDVSAGELVITFNDGTTETHTLPSAGTFGIDQTARDSAATAQTAADTAQTAAGTAQTAADTAQTEIDDHESNHPSGGTGVDQTARDAAEANATALADKMERSDVSAGVGISVLATTGSTTALTISLTGSGMGPTTLSGGQWRFDYNSGPPDGRVFYNGNTTPLEWVFATGGAFNSARAQLLALTPHDEIEIRQTAARHQLITLTLAPTLSGDNVTVTGTTPPRLNHERPENNAAVTVTLIPGPIQGVDQTARDAAGDAQADIDDHETNHPSSGYTNQDARDAARSVVFDWAEQSNGSLIPDAKVSRQIYVQSSGVNINTNLGHTPGDVVIEIDSGVAKFYLAHSSGPPFYTLVGSTTTTQLSSIASWALAGNSDDIPSDKLPVGRFVPNPSGATDGQVAKVQGGVWTIADDSEGTPSGLTASAIASLNMAPDVAVHSRAVFAAVFDTSLYKYEFGHLIRLMRSTAGLGRQINPSGNIGNLGKVPVVHTDGGDFHYQLQKPAELPTVASNAPSNPDHMNSAILYKDTAEGETATELYYKRRHDRESVIIAINDTSPRSFGTEHRSFGWTNRIILDTAEPVPGASPYPSTPPHWEAFIRVQNIASGLYEWRLYTDQSFTTLNTLYLDMRDQDDPDTHIQNVAMTQPVNEAYWTTGTYLYNTFPFYDIAGRARRPVIRIRSANDTLSSSIIHLIPVDDVRETLVDEDRLHQVYADLQDIFLQHLENLTPSGGPTRLGTYTGTLSNTAWTTVPITPTAGKAMIGIVYLGANTHNSFTWNGWGMSWFPRTKFDSTVPSEAAWRYNVRTSGSQLIYVGRAGNGQVQIRVGSVNTESFALEFWEM